MHLRLGTRGSDLALWQTRWVIGALEKRYPGLEVEEVIFQTHGDQRRDAALHSPDLPAGSFVTTLEESMLRDEIDLAVHSCKDLPSQLPEELTIAAFPDRSVCRRDSGSGRAARVAALSFLGTVPVLNWSRFAGTCRRGFQS